MTGIEWAILAILWTVLIVLARPMDAGAQW